MRRLWLRLGLYVAIIGFAIGILMSSLLGAAVKEWIFLSLPIWLMVRGLVIAASLCLAAGVALFIRILVTR